MTTQASQRLSLPLSARDRADLDMIQGSAAHMRELDLDAQASRAATAKAVFEEGLKIVKERIAQDSYAAMGAEQAEIARRRHNRDRLSARGRDRGDD